MVPPRLRRGMPCLGWNLVSGPASLDWIGRKDHAFLVADEAVPARIGLVDDGKPVSLRGHVEGQFEAGQDLGVVSEVEPRVQKSGELLPRAKRTRPLDVGGFGRVD